MKINIREQKNAAKKFSQKWLNRGNERQDSQTFWLELLQNVFGIENAFEYIVFEDSVQNMMDTTSFLDGYIEKTNVLIEQKGRNRDLNKGIKQSDGSYLTPFQQAMKYAALLPYSKRPRWIITCNFEEFHIYDMEKPNSEPSIIQLENLEKEYYRLEILVDKSNTQIEKETTISIQAGELVGEIYDALLKQYKDPNSLKTLQSINQLCVRLVFCFYAEDAGLFGKRGLLHDYLAEYNSNQFRNAIIELFDVLNTRVEERHPYLEEKLEKFPYVNGDLFKDTEIEIPLFTENIRNLILDNASSNFDWSEISPTIFGSVFESTLNPEQRRDGGMHYTSIENIHKVIDPLFLDDLKNELNEIKLLKQSASIKRRAEEFQEKLGSLKFLDPASGSGNFLTETYLELRRLENEAIKLYIGERKLDTEENLIKVNLNQFYGIEINDFAVSVSKTALWIAESQMFEETQKIIYSNINFLPLVSYTNVVEENALNIDWDYVVNKDNLNYIIGNPPFIGARIMNKEQTDDLKKVFGSVTGLGNLDYVAGWYEKASQYIDGTNIKCAFVSTNSITQGQQVPILWKHLAEQHNIIINFAYRTFNWNSEAKDKAAVHCVIVGFSQIDNKNKKLYISDGQIAIANNINGYLLDAPNIFIENRRKPLSNSPKMVFGSMANDGGNLFLTKEEKNYLIKNYPDSKLVIKKIVGAKEYLNDIERYCLWIEEEHLSKISSIKPIMKRIENVKEHRLQSKRSATRELAQIPYSFAEKRQPKKDYLIIPRVSSENRRYIPIGYVDKDIIASDAAIIIPESELYHFAILSSNVHMAWMRTVGGRLKSDYRYSASIVYNNFPWINLSDKQIDLLNESAKEILKARTNATGMSLSDMYNQLIMPKELRKAHQNNDRLVMQIYNMNIRNTKESDAVSVLFELYNKLSKNNI